MEVIFHMKSNIQIHVDDALCYKWEDEKLIFQNFSHFLFLELTKFHCENSNNFGFACGLYPVSEFNYFYGALRH